MDVAAADRPPQSVFFTVPGPLCQPLALFDNAPFACLPWEHGGDGTLLGKAGDAGLLQHSGNLGTPCTPADDDVDSSPEYRTAYQGDTPGIFNGGRGSTRPPARRALSLEEVFGPQLSTPTPKRVHSAHISSLNTRSSDVFPSPHGCLLPPRSATPHPAASPGPHPVTPVTPTTPAHDPWEATGRTPESPLKAKVARRTASAALTPTRRPAYRRTSLVELLRLRTTKENEATPVNGTQTDGADDGSDSDETLYSVSSGSVTPSQAEADYFSLPKTRPPLTPLPTPTLTLASTPPSLLSPITPRTNTAPLRPSQLPPSPRRKVPLDRFVPPRTPTASPTDAFHISKPPSQLSPAERVMRSRANASDPFAARVPRAPPAVEDVYRALGVPEALALRTPGRPEGASSVRGVGTGRAISGGA
ncbi:hypothetical protein EJ06DRAFT_545510, partial [Trichodelitschia bisporula]